MFVKKDSKELVGSGFGIGMRGVYFFYIGVASTANDGGTVIEMGVELS